MTDEQRNLLATRLKAASQVQPEILALRKLLLQFGGTELVAPPGCDPDLEALLQRGELVRGTVLETLMERSVCHQNAAALWTRGDLTGIGTGYALSGELWRQHSWGMRDDCIIETTAARSAYFGLILQGEEAARFASSNPLD